MENVPQTISSDLKQNLQVMQRLFSTDKTILQRAVVPARQGSRPIACHLFCVDGMVNAALINENIIRPIVQHEPNAQMGEDIVTYLQEQVVQINELKQSNNFDDIIYALLYGDTILFCDGCSQALILGTKGFVRRGISEPGSETVLKGPREGLSESILMNLSMIRRKIRTSELKIEYFRVGEETRTTCCFCYIGDIVDHRVLEKLKKRVKTIKIDGVFDANYIVELIRDYRFSPFRTVGSTERPDVVSAKLLEGRVAILVDGSPVAITMPHIFLEHFQSSEDYYVSHPFAALNRLLRIAGFALSVSLLPIYVALITFHQELLPISLLLSISKARQGVLLPTMLEALVLLLIFEILREAGSRVPSSVAQTLSIVGGLVLGQSAVEARIVSVPMLIVVAFCGITGLMAAKLRAGVVLLRVLFLLAAGMLGLHGFALGVLCLLAHLARQQSFGVPTLSNLPLGGMGSGEDSFLRPYFGKMKRFGRFRSHKEEGRP